MRRTFSRTIGGSLAAVLATALAAAPVQAADPEPKQVHIGLGPLSDDLRVGGILQVAGTVGVRGYGPLTGALLTLKYCYQPGAGASDVCDTYETRSSPDSRYSSWAVNVRLKGGLGDAAYFTVSHPGIPDHNAEGTEVTRRFTLQAHGLVEDLDIPRSVAKDTEIHVKGRTAWRRDDGGTTTIGQIPVKLYRSPDERTWTETATGTSASNGYFDLAMKVTEPGYYRVGLAGASVYGSSEIVRVELKQPPVPPSPQLPQPGKEKAELTGLPKSGVYALGLEFAASPRTFLVTPDGKKRPNANALIQVAYSTDGTKWHPYAEVRSDADGRFPLAVYVKSDAVWKVTVASGPWTARKFTVDARALTRLTLNAAPEPVKRGRPLALKGALIDRAFGRPVKAPHAKIALYFRPRGAKTWKFVAWARTDRHGRFAAKAKAWKDGSWQARFSGDPDRYRATSPSDYVDVRQSP